MSNEKRSEAAAQMRGYYRDLFVNNPVGKLVLADILKTARVGECVFSTDSATNAYRQGTQADAIGILNKTKEKD